MNKIFDKLSLELDKIINSTYFDQFILLTITLGKSKHPIRIVNSKKFVFTGDIETNGVVIAYAADHRNLNDRVIFNKLNDSEIFKSFQSHPFGHEGKEFYKYYKLDKDSIICAIENIFKIISKDIDIAQVSIDSSFSETNKI
jgi:hypothetical protein